MLIAFAVVMVIVACGFCLNWVTKRNRYFARLRWLGFEEDKNGLIQEVEGAGARRQSLFSVEDSSSVNPGLDYATARAQHGLFVVNAVLSVYFYLAYRWRLHRQKQVYKSNQLELLDQLATRADDGSDLRDEFLNAFAK